MSDHEPISIDLSGKVDVLDLAAALCRVIPAVAQQIANKHVEESLVMDTLDPLMERFQAEAHAARLGLTIEGTSYEDEDES